jgi:hypothetical protein
MNDAINFVGLEWRDGKPVIKEQPTSQPNRRPSFRRRAPSLAQLARLRLSEAAAQRLARLLGLERASLPRAISAPSRLRYSKRRGAL